MKISPVKSRTVLSFHWQYYGVFLLKGVSEADQLLYDRVVELYRSTFFYYHAGSKER